MFSLLRKSNISQLSKSLFAIQSPVHLNHQPSLKKTIRALSSLALPARPIVSKDERSEFMNVFPDLISYLEETASEHDSKSKDAAKWYVKALQYNVPKGRQIGGLVTVLTYKQIANKSQLTPENIKLAHYLGWCVEMLTSVFHVTNDIMDESVTRRGQACWHRLEDVGWMALNDSLLIENSVFKILKQYFGKKDYIQFLNLFNEASFITLLGHSQDIQTSKGNLSSFTMDRYNNLVANKTSYIKYYFPVSLAMQLCGFTDPEIYAQTKTILLEIGNLFQVQDDFNNCFGNPEITGKIGTDIQENKCSWLAIVCMEIASEAQKEIMEECYGNTDPIKVARVKDLYKELDLPILHAAYEAEIHHKIKTHLQKISKDVPYLNWALLPFFSTKTWTEVFRSCHTPA